MQSENVKILTYNAFLSALYIALTFISPFSFGIINFRLADIIQIIACLDKRSRMGISVGMVISNLFSPYGIVDAFTAIAICIISFYFGWKINSEKVRVGILILTTSVSVAIEICFLEKVPFLMIFTSIMVSETFLCSLGYFIIKKYDFINRKMGGEQGNL